MYNYIDIEKILDRQLMWSGHCISFESSAPRYNPNEVKGYNYEEVTKFDDKGNSSKYMRTTMQFADGCVTTSEAPIEVANQYVGFIVCAAKHAYGNDNTISNLADYWITEKPKKEAKEKAKRDKIEEQAKEAERIKAKKIEKKRIYKIAKARKEEYEAAKLAYKKYGIPMDYNSGNSND